MEVKIRKAEEKDYAKVLDIMNQVQKLHVEWRPDIYKTNENFFELGYLKELIEKDCAYVAEAEGEAVGFMEIMFRHVTSPAHVTRDFVFIDTMAVDEKYRGRGIGHKFFDKVKEIKEEKGLDGIELQVNARNKAAYEMYKKCGFTEKSINMELL